MSAPITEIAKALGVAYHTAEVGKNRQRAIAALVEMLGNDPERRTAAEATLANLNTVISARTMGGVCGCHISAVQHDLLTAALAAPRAGGI